MRIISLGAGVQSSTLFLKSCYGDLPKADCAIFADTQQEPEQVYTYLEFLKTQGEAHGIPVYVVSAGDLGADALARKGGDLTRYANIPFRLKWDDGKGSGLMRRQCTGHYKLEPIRRKVRELLKDAGEKHAELWIGISTDESGRMKDSRVKYITNIYPLIEARMSRFDCLHWYTEQKLPHPPRSACVFCPYRSDQEWTRLKREEPAAFDRAVEFDREIRRMPGIEGTCYIHRSLRPLDEIDFDEPGGQSDLFGEECEGMCGI